MTIFIVTELFLLIFIFIDFLDKVIYPVQIRNCVLAFCWYCDIINDYTVGSQDKMDTFHSVTSLMPDAPQITVLDVCVHPQGLTYWAQEVTFPKLLSYPVSGGISGLPSRGYKFRGLVLQVGGWVTGWQPIPIKETMLGNRKIKKRKPILDLGCSVLDDYLCINVLFCIAVHCSKLLVWFSVFLTSHTKKCSLFISLFILCCVLCYFCTLYWRIYYFIVSAYNDLSFSPINTVS